MALLLLIALGAAAPNTSNGQSQFVLQNFTYGSSRLVDAPVYDGAGNPLAGTNYLVELWGSAQSNSLAPAVTYDSYVHGHPQRRLVPFLTGEYAGYFYDNETVLITDAYYFAWLQVRAWDARLGSTYEEVEALGIGGYGETPVWLAEGSPWDYEPPLVPALLIGMESFSLRPIVPEPTALSILTLGSPALVMVRRRR